MLNQVVIVGRISSEIKKEEIDDKKTCIITLAVPRSFKNVNGEYETDFIKCKLWNGIADNVIEYCKQGDLIGVKGRLQTTKVDDKYILELIAEKVTFLSSRPQNGEGENK